MSSLRKVDVLVIGLGPAGSSAAAAAARAGLSVLCIDRKRQVGVPVQCAEFVPLPLTKYAQAKGVLRQRIDGMRTMLPSGGEACTALPGLMVDRAAFDQALAMEAQRHGAEVMLATRLVDVDWTRRVARVGTGRHEFDLAYQVLVAADGPHSRVAQVMGLPPLQIVHARQYTVPLLDDCSDTDIWLSDDYPGGYAWLFPKGRVANLGLGIDRQCAHDLRQPLDALHQHLVEQGRVGREIVYRTGGAIPVGGLRENLLVDSVLFVGDAAGFTHPVTGAGIAAAVASGERAGEAAARWLARADVNALAQFEQDMREQFEPSLQRAVARRHWLIAQGDTRASGSDAVHRKRWIAFPEYFAGTF